MSILAAGDNVYVRASAHAMDTSFVPSKVSLKAVSNMVRRAISVSFVDSVQCRPERFFASYRLAQGFAFFIY